MELVKNEPMTNFYASSSIDALTKVNSDGINLSIWQRDTNQVQSAAQALLETSFTRTQFIYDRADSIELIGAFLDETTGLESPDAPYLWADIMLLTEQMLKLCDDQEIGIGLERVTHDNCTSFHTDFLSLRLLCTYWGDATHWLADDNVNRDGLGKNNNDLVVKDWSQVNKMEPHWVGIFKGENFAGNKGCGIVHRSPEIVGKDNADRLLLRIDTINSFGS